LDPSPAKSPAAVLPGLALVALENIHRAPCQPRTTTSLELVHQLADSMRAGRHEPLLEVESLAGRSGHYQIVCGEQRWRAAKEAGVERVLVRVLDGLGPLARLQKQYEENRLRAGLTPVDDAHVVLLAKSIKDIERAEQLLAEHSIPFQPLSSKEVKDRSDLENHLASLKALLLEHKVHLVRSETEPRVAPLSPWRETERALGISEAARKRKLDVLRLEPEVLADANSLPNNHAVLIAQVEGHQQRAELAARASQLSHRRLHAAVRRLRENPALTVDQALSAHRPIGVNPFAFEDQLRILADLCRQIIRLLTNLKLRISEKERDEARAVLAVLLQDMHAFLDQGAVV
jgi:ParB/RepB/Spo0J family partition protein